MSHYFGLGETFFDDDTERAPGEETAEEGVNIPDDVNPDEPEA